MSTSYYLPKPPITSLRMETTGPHDKLSVFVDHKLAGTLVVDAGDGPRIASLFADESPILHTWYGGDEFGTVVKIMGDHQLTTETVISEYGGVSLVSDVLAKSGAGKKK